MAPRTERQKELDRLRYQYDTKYREQRKSESRKRYALLRSDPKEVESLRRAGREASARWRNSEKYRAKLARRRERAKEKYKADPIYRAKRLEACRVSHIKRKYGLTPAAYEALFTQQGGVCLLCQKPPRGKQKMAVDHCHKTGRVRGLMHQQCNYLFGVFGDDPVMLRAAADRLEGN